MRTQISISTFGFSSSTLSGPEITESMSFLPSVNKGMMMIIKND